MEDGKKVFIILLTLIGFKNYSIIRSPVTPILSQEKTFNPCFEGTFPTKAPEKNCFYQRTHAFSESVQDDVVNLEISVIKLCETDWYLDGQHTEASAKWTHHD